MVGVKNDLREKKKKTVNTDIKSYSPVPQLFFFFVRDVEAM
jgi:hypothetical protein